MATVPPLSHPCWQRLANGALARLKTQHLGTQLLMKRLERTPTPAATKAAELHAFFTKWERALPTEISQIHAL